MELGLEQREERPLVEQEQSFYPCFNGIRVGTALNTRPIMKDNKVSILVLMELGLEQPNQKKISMILGQFLSLF